MTEPRAQLYLTTPTDGRPLAPALADAFAGGTIACVRIAGSEALSDAVLAEAIGLVQSDGAAALLDGDPARAERLRADGVHLEGLAGLPMAIRRIKPAGIVGVGGLRTRDDAMTAGEMGPDYLAFGNEPDLDGVGRLERVAWWTEIFQVPCVAHVHGFDEIAPVVAVGAEFVGLAKLVWDDPDGAAAAVRRAEQAVEAGHAAFLARRAEVA